MTKITINNGLGVIKWDNTQAQFAAATAAAIHTIGGAVTSPEWPMCEALAVVTDNITGLDLVVCDGTLMTWGEVNQAADSGVRFEMVPLS